MARVHAAIVFIVGLVAIVASLSVLYVLSGLWSGWQASGSFIDMVLSVSTFSITAVGVTWLVFVHWASILNTAGESADDE